MVSKKLFLLFLLLSTFSFIACEKTTLFKNSGQVLAYGSSFGECAGACYREIRINEAGEVNFIVRYNGVESKNESYSDQIDIFKRAEIKESVSLKDMEDLEDVYGCPDCVDGGAEWIEWIENEESIKKVIFDYGNPPKKIEKVIDLLRQQKTELSHKFISQQ